MKGFILKGLSARGKDAVRDLDMRDKKAVIILNDYPEDVSLHLTFLHRWRLLPLLKESTEVFIHKYMSDKGLVRGVDYDIEFT